MIKSEINKDTIGNKNEYCFLVANKDPLNNAMAICGAKPIGLLGIILYKALIATIITKARIICLFNFIKYLFKRMETKITLSTLISAIHFPQM